MGYIQDFKTYLSGTEIPEDFMLWSALSLESALCGKKVWTMHGDYFTINPNLFICLVGSPASGKSTAKDVAKDIFTTYFPEYLISSEIQSREHICQSMASDEGCRVWKKPGECKVQSYRPFYALVDEFSLFVSVDARNMVDFLVGIFSSKDFGTGFKRDANMPQRVRDPYFSLLACTVPEWIMSHLKMDLFTGGLGRRLIIVPAEKNIKDLKPNPKKPQHGDACFARVIEHLKAVEKLVGEVKRSPEANEWWEAWYKKHFSKQEHDPIMTQFDSSKHVMVLKIATLLALDERPFKMEISITHMAQALALLDGLEPKINKLTAGIGTNIMAGVAAQMEQFVIAQGGMITEKLLLAQFYRLSPNGEKDFQDALNFLVKTEKLIVADLVKSGKPVRFVATPKALKAYQEGNKLEIKK